MVIYLRNPIFLLNTRVRLFFIRKKSITLQYCIMRRLFQNGPMLMSSPCQLQVSASRDRCCSEGIAQSCQRMQSVVLKRNGSYLSSNIR